MAEEKLGTYVGSRDNVLEPMLFAIRWLRQVTVTCWKIIQNMSLFGQFIITYLYLVNGSYMCMYIYIHIDTCWQFVLIDPI